MWWTVADSGRRWTHFSRNRDLDFIVADVDQSFVSLDLSVAVFDCCAWWRVAMVIRGGHSVHCTFRHGRHLCTGANDCIDVALLTDGGLHGVLLLAEAFGKGSCLLCAQF